MKTAGIAISFFTMIIPTAFAQSDVAFNSKQDRVHITVSGKKFADYLFQDDTIRRPYFAHVHSPGGIQVTRNLPPVEGKDATDHATMHPGIWLAFGDLGGGDFWRNKGVVRHIEFVERPARDAKQGTFAVQHRYELAGNVIAEERCRIQVQARPSAILLLLDSQFTSAQGAIFGDQEEMGLGVRVATSLSVKAGGHILDSAGRKNEKQVWGKQADWCAYAGTSAGHAVGVLLMPHPKNFRKSWFHARDYGLLVANPFGQKAFTRGEPSRVAVKPGESLRLQFGMLVYDGKVDFEAAFADYLKVAQ